MKMPRPTQIHQRRQAMMLATFERLSKNDDFRFLVVSGGEALRQKDNDAGRSIAQALVDMVCREEPDYVKLVGRGELLRELATLISAQVGLMRYPEVTTDAAAEVMAQEGNAFTSTKRISPDNEISLLRGNALVTAGASKADIVEMGSYMASAGPERRGREKGSKDKRRRKQRYPVKPGDAAKAYAKLQAGATKKSVFGTLWPGVSDNAGYAKLKALIAPHVAERGEPVAD